MFVISRHLRSNVTVVVRQLFCGLFGSNSNVPPVTVIPSRVIATWARDDWDYALYFFG